MFSNNLSLLPLKNFRFLSQFNHLCTKTPFPSDPLPHSQSQDPENDPSNHFSKKIDDFPMNISAEAQSHLEVISKDCVLETLLSHKADPKSALKFFKGAVRRRGFVKTVDVLCLLVHILASSPDTYGVLRSLLNNYVFADSSPTVRVLVEELVECSRRYNFESDSRVFNYLLNAYVRANKVTDAVECLRLMLEHDLVPWVPFMNILLTALVRRNMIRDTYSLYDEMVQRKIYGDCFTLHVLMRACLKEGKIEEAEMYFSQAKDRGLLV
ncbi:hypothetical protein PIB30_038550 [Stylosanthes scabra]|uniref:Pentatricopeptide repeat-containing protein n=1 Tax=Stylosanthes scabra TaxID=79078 RepID=A0ABU6XBQ7_9FABA|nr:hypothetical protein [Stylosanthes scabra]